MEAEELTTSHRFSTVNDDLCLEEPLIHFEIIHSIFPLLFKLFHAMYINVGIVEMKVILTVHSQNGIQN